VDNHPHIDFSGRFADRTGAIEYYRSIGALPEQRHA